MSEKVIVGHDLNNVSSTLRSRMIKGLGANLVGNVINLVSRLALPPLFLHAWGVDIYGEWLLLSSFAAYLSLSDMGGQLYVVNRLTQAHASKDMDLFRTLLRTGLTVFLVMPGIFFLGFVLFISLYHVESIFGIVNTSRQEVLWVLIVLAFQFLFSLPQGILLGVYRAIGMYPRGVMLGNMITLLQLVMTALLLLGKSSMVVIAGIQVVPYLLVAVIALIDLGKRFPELQVCSLSGASLRVALGFVRPSFYFLIIQLAQMISIQGTLLAVGAALGTAQVVLFGVLRTMVFSARQILGLLSHAAWPEITRLDALGDKKKLRRLFLIVFNMTMLAAFAIATILHFFGNEIFRLWLGDKVQYSQSAMDMFLIYVLFNVLWTTCSHLPMALNRHTALARLSLLASVSGVALAYVGGINFGLEGAVAGMLIGEAVFVTWYIPLLIWRYLQNA